MKDANDCTHQNGLEVAHSPDVPPDPFSYSFWIFVGTGCHDIIGGIGLQKKQAHKKSLQIKSPGHLLLVLTQAEQPHYVACLVADSKMRFPPSELRGVQV